MKISKIMKILMRAIINFHAGHRLNLPIQEWSKKILLKWRFGLRHLDTLKTVSAPLQAIQWQSIWGKKL